MSSNYLFAQTSLVPAHHPVYDYLFYQRVVGNIPFYNHEDLPISRGEIVEYLRKIEVSESLNFTDRETIEAYLVEFDPLYLRRTVEKGVFTGKGPIKERLEYYLTSNDEPHIFSVYDTTNSIFGAIDPLFAGQAAVKGWENDNELTSRYFFKGGRIYASIEDFLGIHIEATNVSATGNSELLLYDNEWGNALPIIQNKKSASYAYETFGTFKKGTLSFDIGTGSLRIGPGISSPLILSEDAPNMSWMRFKFDTKEIKYTAIHASLYAERYDTYIYVGQDSLRTRVAPDRYLSLHRFSIQPLKQIKLSFTEYLIYSNRTFDMSRANPFAPLVFLELDGQDRDNLLMSFDIIINPINRLELYGAVLIDDLTSFKNLFKDVKMKDNDVAYNAGLRLALPNTMEFSTGFTRIQPFVYTHWQPLNAVTHRTKSLGHYIGPNSQLIDFNLKKWLRYRTRIDVTYRINKKGFNPLNHDGEVIENVGGDINLGSEGPRQEPYLFLENADINKWNEVEIAFQFEPKRGIIITGRYIEREVFSGNRVPDFRYIDLRLRLGF
ncbi:MAG: hypothetical protein BalsKO_20220 [Balneolaceae bacterium]